MKLKKCKSCKTEFEPIKPIQPRCFSCTLEFARISVTKERNQNKRLERDKLKSGLMTKGDYEKALQVKINYMVRLIDEGCRCIACNKYKDKFDAGHMMPTSTHPFLRFHLMNIWAECRYDNSYKSSKFDYVDGLIREFGQDVFDYITGLKLEWKDLSWEIHELKEWIKKSNECIKFIEWFKKENPYPLNNSDRILLRVQVNELMGIYKSELMLKSSEKTKVDN
jgi:hypothetical protein